MPASSTSRIVCDALLVVLVQNIVNRLTIAGNIESMVVDARSGVASQLSQLWRGTRRDAIDAIVCTHQSRRLALQHTRSERWHERFLEVCNRNIHGHVVAIRLAVVFK